MKTIWIILIVVQCIITYLMIGFGITLIYSKKEYGNYKAWAKEDSVGVVGVILACLVFYFSVLFFRQF